MVNKDRITKIYINVNYYFKQATKQAILQLLFFLILLTSNALIINLGGCDLRHKNPISLIGLLGISPITIRIVPLPVSPVPFQLSDVHIPPCQH